MAEGDASPIGSRPIWSRWQAIASAALILLLILAAAAWWFLHKPAKLNVWHAATVPYSARCAGGCKPWRPIAPAHGGAPPNSSSHPPQLVYNPKVDDAVAQWGDCLQSIMTCTMKLPHNDDKGFRGCVASSICPRDCKDRFATEAGSDMDSAEAAYYHVFTDPDAVCRPEDNP